MEALQFTRSTGNYQFPTATLTPLALPQVGDAMRSAMPVVFAANEAYRVDLGPHSSLCLRGYSCGLLRESDMSEFAVQPSLLALHRLTGKLVANIGSRATFKGEGLFLNRAQVQTTLAMKEVDKAVTAEVALGLIEAGVLDAHSLQETLCLGAYTAPLVQDMLVSRMEELSGAKEIGFEVSIFGQAVVLETDQPFYYDFSLRNVPVTERQELNVLLLKAFDAISRFVFPLHTPHTFCGTGSYMTHGLGDALDELKKITTDFTVEGLAALIQAKGMEGLPFEAETLGLCDDEQGELDADSVERVASLLAEAKAFDDTCGFHLSYSDPETVITEVRQLLDEAKALAASGKSTAPAHALVVETLEYALSFAESKAFDYNDWSGSHEDGMAFAEAFVIRMDTDEYSSVYDEAYSYVDSIMNESGFSALVAEADRDVVARQVVRTMEAIKKVDCLLRSLSTAIEAIQHAV
jgi:hypothetical protein